MAMLDGAGAGAASRLAFMDQMPPEVQITDVGDLDILQAGVIFPFMFGWVAPVRPSMIWSLQHPEYQVRG